MRRRYDIHGDYEGIGLSVNAYVMSVGK